MMRIERDDRLKSVQNVQKKLRKKIKNKNRSRSDRAEKEERLRKNQRWFDWPADELEEEEDDYDDDSSFEMVNVDLISSSERDESSNGEVGKIRNLTQYSTTSSSNHRYISPSTPQRDEVTGKDGLNVFNCNCNNSGSVGWINHTSSDSCRSEEDSGGGSTSGNNKSSCSTSRVYDVVVGQVDRHHHRHQQQQQQHQHHHHHLPPPPRLELQLSSPFTIDLEQSANEAVTTEKLSSSIDYLPLFKFITNPQPSLTGPPSLDSGFEMTGSIKLHYQLSEASHSAPDLSSPPIPSSGSNQTVSKKDPQASKLASTSITVNDLRLEKRFQAFLEIISTESNYLNDLRYLRDFYWPKLDSFDYIDNLARSKIKRNFDQLIQLTERFHKRLSLAIGSNSRLLSSAISVPELPALSATSPPSSFSTFSTLNLTLKKQTHPQTSIPETRARDEVEVDRLIERLAKAFISESPIFTVYEEFCARHTEAADIIRSFESTPEWQSIMQQPIQAYQSTSAPLPSSTATTLTSLCPTTVSTLTTNFNLESNYLFNVSSIIQPPSPESNNSKHLNSQLSKLTLQDLIIKPIQRVMRYPMLLSSLLKHMGSNLSNPIECRAKERVSQALSAMREVAEAVDRAKSMREVELKTELIASRIELHSSYRSAFVRLLGQIRLVGSLHLLYHGPTFDSANSGLGSNNSEAFKIKYLGVFLYQTHLVIVKAKRATVYEPRHWFPIRYFDLVDVSDHSGLMPYSFSLKFRQHTFEFGAKTEAEKIVWVKELSQVKEEIERQRQVHSLSDQPLGDDSIVSSINLNSHDSINEDQATRGTSMRTPDDNQPPSPVASQVTPTNQQQAGIPGSNSQHNCEELPPTPSALSHPPKVSQRLSRNVNTLLGRTPEVAQAAIDLKLTEVFSEVLLCARLQDSNVQRSGGHTIGHSSRARTSSATTALSNKRQNSSTMINRLGDRKLKRMSCMEPSTFRTMENAPPLPTRAHSNSPERLFGEDDMGISRRRSDAADSLCQHQDSQQTDSPSDDEDLRASDPLDIIKRSSRSVKSSCDGVEEGVRRDEGVCDVETTDVFEITNKDAEENENEEDEMERTIELDEDSVETQKYGGLRAKSSLSSIHSNSIWLPGLRLARRFSRAGSSHQIGQKVKKAEHESPGNLQSQTFRFESGTKRSRATKQSTDSSGRNLDNGYNVDQDEDSRARSVEFAESHEEGHVSTAKNEVSAWRRGFKLSSNPSPFASINRLKSTKSIRKGSLASSKTIPTQSDGPLPEQENQVKAENEAEEDHQEGGDGRRWDKNSSEGEKEKERGDKQLNHLPNGLKSSSPRLASPSSKSSRKFENSNPYSQQKSGVGLNQKDVDGIGRTKSKGGGAKSQKISNGLGSVLKSVMKFSKNLGETGMYSPGSNSSSSSPSPNRNHHHHHHHPHPHHHNHPRNMETGLGIIKS